MIVSTPRGEIRTLIEAADAARSLDAEQPDLLAETILACRRAPDETAAMARRGREWVETGFVRDDLARRMLSFVVRTVAQAGRAGTRGRARRDRP